MLGFRHDAEQRWVCDHLALVWLGKKLFANWMRDLKAGGLLSTSNYLVIECFIIQSHRNGNREYNLLWLKGSRRRNKYSRLSLLIYLFLFFFSRLNPTAALDFVWTCFHSPRLWQGRDQKSTAVGSQGTNSVRSFTFCCTCTCDRTDIWKSCLVTNAN